MSDRDQQQDEDAQDPFSHLTPEVRARLARALTVELPDVQRANRVIEHRTGFTSDIGRNNMVDVLSHLGTLAREKDLSPVDQASQLAKIEEHLRRVIIEHPEEVLRQRINEIRERWDTYMLEARPYREKSAMGNAPPHSELEADRAKVRELLETGRASKAAETPWEETLSAGAAMTEAAAVNDELGDKVLVCIGTARELKRIERRARLMVLIAATSLLLAIATFFVGRATAPEPKTHPRNAPSHTQTQP